MFHQFQFGEFTLDTEEECLYRGEIKVNLNRRTIQVLHLLVERPNKIITKQEFFDTIWADAFVEEANLSVAVAAIRKALGDDSKSPQFIENFPRKGYRFIAKVEVFEKQPEIEMPEVENTTADAKIEKLDDEVTTNFRPLLTNSQESSSKMKKFVPVGIFLICLLILFSVSGFNYFNSDNRKSSRNDAWQIESIAILPFESQDGELDYLSDGLTESVIGELSALPNLRVISRNSVFQYKNKPIDLPTIGRELNVRTVLTGSLERRDDNLIISLELKDTHNNQRIWERQYSRKIAVLADLQQELLQDISEILREKSSDSIRLRRAKRRTENSEAFLFYLKGQYQWNKRTHDSFLEAVKFYNQAIESDPTFAPAYVGLAACYLSVDFKDAVTLKERAAMVKAAANKALEIDPNLGGEVYATLAINSHFNEWNWTNAEKEYKHAIELSPNYATAHHWYAEFLATEGRFEESFAEYQKAIELDPLSLAVKTDLGLNFYYARQFDRAVEYLEKLKIFEPNYMRTHHNLAVTFEKKEMFLQAIEAYDQSYLLDGFEPQTAVRRKTMLENAVKASGAKGYWEKKMEIVTTIDGQNNPVVLAKIHAALGERDQTFALLEEGYNQRSSLLVWLKVSPEFDGVRSDSRFADLVRRVGIP